MDWLLLLPSLALRLLMLLGSAETTEECGGLLRTKGEGKVGEIRESCSSWIRGRHTAPWGANRSARRGAQTRKPADIKFPKPANHGAQLAPLVRQSPSFG